MDEALGTIPPDWYDGFFDAPEWLDLLAAERGSAQVEAGDAVAAPGELDTFGEDDNRRVVELVARSLRPGGRFLVDVTGAWGSFDGADLSFEAPRLILRAERPATLAP